jgi:hypothetical protein
MPNRVRIVANHPNFGTVKNEYACNLIKQTWHEKFPFTRVDHNWPKWREILWMASEVGNWKIKVLREPRRSKASKSLYGKWLIQWGLNIPPLRKKNKKGQVHGKKLVINGRAYSFVGAQGVVQPPQPNIHWGQGFQGARYNPLEGADIGVVGEVQPGLLPARNIVDYIAEDEGLM